MVTLTTLTGNDGFSRKNCVDIYAARWSIESLCKEPQSFMAVEPFHSTTVHGCEQEIAASLLWMALAAYLQGEAERTLDGRKVYRTECLRAATDLVALFLAGLPIEDATRR